MKPANKIFFKELLRLLLFVALGLVITLCVCMPIAAIIGIFSHYSASNLFEGALPMHLLMWGQSAFIMFLPAIWWCKDRLRRNPYECYGFRKVDYRWLLLSFAYAVCFLGGFDFINTFIYNFDYPDWMHNYIIEEKIEANNTTQILMNLPGLGGWIECILLAAIVTGIVEETMFRGALLKCFGLSTLNKHWVAICVGLIFSAIHFEFLGFVDRFIFGVIAVYMVYWSGSIWPSIVMHTTNNLICVIQAKLSDAVDPLDPQDPIVPWYVGIVGLVVTGLLVRAMWQMRVPATIEPPVFIPQSQDTCAEPCTDEPCHQPQPHEQDE